MYSEKGEFTLSVGNLSFKSTRENGGRSGGSLPSKGHDREAVRLWRDCFLA